MSTTRGTAAVSLIGLTKYYGSRRGVEQVTFDVAPGEVVGFLGPNGAGKTTTMRMLVGLLRITRGQAVVLGVDIARAPPGLRARIGYLPGALALYSNLTGRQFLTFAARMRGLAVSGRIDGLAERLDLDLDRHIHDLSKGNRQKVGVIQAFLHEPDVLILDEPTSGLDPLVQREFEGMVDEATARGAAILLSSHVLSEVDHLADRVAIVNQGRLVVVQSVEGLRQGALRTIELAFSRPVDTAALAMIEGATGVIQAVAHGSLVTCTVRGSEHDLLRVAVDCGVDFVRSRDPGLDEIFLSLVAGGDGNAGAPADQDVA
ncbi:MAG: ABC transporter ATP-binding protein [Actinomycetota bacterium]|nr:ABC transporter ATP-binding protein [Actinomycetota bacterium]